MAEEHQPALDAMRELFKAEKADARFPLDDACLLRYLRARDFDVDRASAMLRATLAWRAENRVGEISTDPEMMASVRSQNATGKTYARGFDSRGRACLYMKPRLENAAGDHDGQILHLTYNMERAVAMLRERGHGVEKLCMLIDFKGYSVLNAPPMKTSMATLNILQNHYPERLGAAYLLNPPWIFSSFFRMISPFIDPVTRDKICFVTGKEAQRRALLLRNFDEEELEVDAGGRNAVPFRSDAYLSSPLGEDVGALLRGRAAPAADTQKTLVDRLVEGAGATPVGVKVGGLETAGGRAEDRGAAAEAAKGKAEAEAPADEETKPATPPAADVETKPAAMKASRGVATAATMGPLVLLGLIATACAIFLRD